MMYVTSAGGF
jgi:hypothetical protein